MFITTSELIARTGLSRVTLWRYRKRYPDFPQPIEITGSSVLRWVAEEIDEWLLSRRQKRGVSDE
jgi:predicted DNA-binding transcriptional regulator AlpA